MHSRVWQLADRYWQMRLAADPIEATLLGDHRYDDRLPDLSDEADQRERHELESLLQNVRAASTSFDVTLAALAIEIENDLSQRACRLWQWSVDPRDGVQVAFQSLAQLSRIESESDGRNFVARWKKIGPFIRQRTALLRQALGERKVATAGSVARVLRQLDELLATPQADWIMAQPSKAAHPAWSETARAAFRAGVTEAVADIAQALAQYRDVLRHEIAPRARSDDQVGILHVPGGASCYERLIRVHTSLSLSAEQIHAIGREENVRIRAEMIALGSRIFGTSDFSEIQRHLHSDRALYFDSRQAIEDKARDALERARQSMPRWLARLPKTPCVVKRTEPFEEKDSFVGYYRQAAVDGSRPGAYYVNTYAPETRPRFEAEVLAFHESIPGHHVQIALAQEQSGPVAEFRKHLGVTSFVEGWALYAERLADEFGLYSGDLDRLGMLSFDAWRASRLVVDTGIHALGWSRSQAVAYLRDNTFLTANNIDNEVDRYIGWPGQALAYKLGQRFFLNLRARAQERLGARLDLRELHSMWLSQGALPLAVLEALTDVWIAKMAKSATGFVPPAATGPSPSKK